ncbi:MAG: LysE family transporter [Actinobacteria bacterium]|nr:LysE family transporter [Actinomycetota bacterium]
MGALLAGFLTGLSLIIAIGAQNAFVLRTGLAKHHVSIVVVICALSDICLIFLGVAGIGGIVKHLPVVLQILRWIQAFMKAFRQNMLMPTESNLPSAKAVAISALALTFLNPHVYLDTVLLLGSLGNQYGASRWLFAAGACIGSVLWFSTLGFGARYAARLMGRPVTWRILDSAIGLVMLLVALQLVFSPLPH